MCAVRYRPKSDVEPHGACRGHSGRTTRSIDQLPERSSTVAMKAVFDTKPSSGYDDDLTRHYQFPRRYLGQVKEAVGDWVVLRRPRADGGNLAYFAVAKWLALNPIQLSRRLRLPGSRTTWSSTVPSPGGAKANIPSRRCGTCRSS